MSSNSVTLELEVPSSDPPQKVFKVFNDFDTLAPKVNPQVFKSIETVEGDGGVGTKKVFTFGDAVPFNTGKYKVDEFDKNNLSYSYTFYEGDNLMGILDSVNTHVKVVPGPDGGSIFKQKVVYNCKGNEKPSEDFLKLEKENYEKTFKGMEAYAASHPEVYG